MLPLILGSVALAVTGYGVKNGMLKPKKMIFLKMKI